MHVTRYFAPVSGRDKVADGEARCGEEEIPRGRAAISQNTAFPEGVDNNDVVPAPRAQGGRLVLGRFGVNLENPI